MYTLRPHQEEMQTLINDSISSGSDKLIEY